MSVSHVFENAVKVQRWPDGLTLKDWSIGMSKNGPCFTVRLTCDCDGQEILTVRNFVTQDLMEDLPEFQVEAIVKLMSREAEAKMKDCKEPQRT